MGVEWIIILAVLILIFGASQIPKLARAVGQAMRELKKAGDDDEA